MSAPGRLAMLDAIELTPVDAAAPGRDAFEAVTQPVPWPKAYGGDLVAPALAAMDRTVADDRTVHSLHSYFLRPAEIGVAVRYEVERLRDGRGYSTREVRASQDGKLLYIALGSYHVGERFGDLQATPPPVPPPEELPDAAQTLAGRGGPAAEYWSGEGRSFAMRHVDGPIYFSVEGAHVPHQALWLRSFAPLPDDPALHRIALAYACDYTILEPILRGHGLAWQDPGLVTASLDHAMWFHRPGRADEWVLYAQEAESAQSGRGLARGRFFSRDGVHLATVLQEGMIRR
ncbi:MAG TPA: acyl-CoA thioesterase domain-containing protein [Solirubrobacteraceae bacterium]|nr:acyl-CoA thioesterase domain-containing protein [Solirubrobacteraceae bacterium]